jgi:hypothetical protein
MARTKHVAGYEITVTGEKGFSKTISNIVKFDCDVNDNNKVLTN